MGVIAHHNNRKQRISARASILMLTIYDDVSFSQSMDRQIVKLEMKAEHVELLETLKQEYGVQSRSRALEMLLDDLLKAE